MELALWRQDDGHGRFDHKIVYDTNSICFTGVPHSIKRLLHQRGRWQHGCMDCLLKHRNMIADQAYGILGLVAMSYQLVFEMLGLILFTFAPLFGRNLPQSWSLFAVYVAYSFFLYFMQLILMRRKMYGN